MLGKYNFVLYQTIVCIIYLTIFGSTGTQAASCARPSVRTDYDEVENSTAGKDLHNHYHSHNHFHVQLALNEELAKADDHPTIDVYPSIIATGQEKQCKKQTSSTDQQVGHEGVNFSTVTSRKTQGHNVEEDGTPEEKFIPFQTGEIDHQDNMNWRNDEEDYNENEYRHNYRDDLYDDERDDMDTVDKRDEYENDEDTNVVTNDYQENECGIKGDRKKAKRIRNNKQRFNYEDNEKYADIPENDENIGDGNDHALQSSNLGNSLARRNKNVKERKTYNVDDLVDDYYDNTHAGRGEAGKSLHDGGINGKRNRNRNYGNNEDFIDEEEENGDHNLDLQSNRHDIISKKQSDTTYVIENKDRNKFDTEDPVVSRNTDMVGQNKGRNRSWKSTSRAPYTQDYDLYKALDRPQQGKARGKTGGIVDQDNYRYKGENIAGDEEQGLPDELQDHEEKLKDKNVVDVEDDDALGDINIEDLQAHKEAPANNEDDYHEDDVGEGVRDRYTTTQGQLNGNSAPSNGQLSYPDTLGGYYGPGRRNRPTRVQHVGDEHVDYERQHYDDEGYLAPKPSIDTYNEGIEHASDRDHYDVTHQRAPIEKDQFKPAAPINKPRVTMWPCITVKNRVVPFYQPIPCQIPSPKCSRVIIS